MRLAGAALFALNGVVLAVMAVTALGRGGVPVNTVNALLGGRFALSRVSL